MRLNRRSILSIGLLVVGVNATLSSSLFAQVTVAVSSDPREVISAGLSEVMGTVSLTSIASQSTVTSTFAVLYQSTQVSNLFASTFMDTSTGKIVSAGGLEIQFSSEYRNSTAASLISATATNTSGGGQILSIPDGIALSAGASIQVKGVRGNMLGKSVGSNVAVL